MPLYPAEGCSHTPVIAHRVAPKLWAVVTGCLTLSPPAVLYSCGSKGSAPYWSNPSFLIFDVRALWRSVLGARAPECQKFKMVGQTSMAKCKVLTGSAVKGLSVICVLYLNRRTVTESASSWIKSRSLQNPFINRRRFDFRRTQPAYVRSSVTVYFLWLPKKSRYSSQ